MPRERGARRPSEDARRTELIDAAWRVIAREGVAAATTRRIAAEAGLPKGMVHYWFAGKDDLLGAVVTRLVERIRGLAGTAPGESPPADVASRFLRAFSAVTDGDRREQLAIYELTLRALRDPELEHVARLQYEAYRNAAAAVVGDLAPAMTDEDLAATSQLVSALFDGVALAWLADPDGTDVSAIFRLAGQLLTSHLAAAHARDVE